MGCSKYGYVHLYLYKARSQVRKLTRIDHLTWIQSWITTLTNHPSLQPTTPEYKAQNQNPSTTSSLLSLSIQIFITASNPIDDTIITHDIPWTRTAPPNVPVCIDWGKPDFSMIMEGAKAEQVGAMAVSICGPGGMGDDVRRAVRERQGRRVMDLYEESFSW